MAVPFLLIMLPALVLASCSKPAGKSENVPGIPVYPGAEIEASQPAVTAADPDAEESRDPTDSYLIPGADQAEVLAWYREQMAEAGWTAVSPADEEVVIYNDAQGCYAFVSISTTDEGVFLQISRQNPATPCIPMRLSDPGTS